MKTRLLAAALALTAVFSMAGCGPDRLRGKPCPRLGATTYHDLTSYTCKNSRHGKTWQ